MIVSADSAIEFLNKGEIVALPTETVYGLAGAISRPLAIEKIFATKERPFFDPLIVHIGSAKQLLPLVRQFPPAAQILAEKFWPGPLTLVLPKSDAVSAMITASHDTVAIRMPAHAIALQILKETGPLAAPSANKFGRLSPTKAQDVEDEFQSQIPVVDGGACDIGVESTILKIEQDSQKLQLSLLRPGMISQEEITEALSAKHLLPQWQEPKKQEAPGQLPNHYQPTLPLVVIEHNVPPEAYRSSVVLSKLQLDGFSATHLWSWKSSSPKIVARSMYGELRHISQSYDNGYIQLILPENFRSPEWSTIFDRLLKASSLWISFDESKVTYAKK